MNKKHLIWSLFTIAFGFLATFIFFELSSSSVTYIQAYFFDSTEISPIKEITEVEEISHEFNANISNTKVTDFNLENPSSILEIINMTDVADIVSGLLMFRGNLSRTWYGTGPLPSDPVTTWKYPKERMCSPSSSGGKTSIWCGTGWTGQPVVWQKENGDQEVIFGAYDRKVHFLDAKTGHDVRPPFETGDIIKGSVTLDPDGFPLLYFGSRDNKLRILSLENDQAKELWALDSETLGGMWNNDWDSNPAIIDDVLYEGGENGWFYAILLNRIINKEGHVSVNPQIIFSMPSYNDDLIKKIGRNVSIENSLAFFDKKVYFSNSGGRVLGLDISNIKKGLAPVIFDYWVGDDVDATIVIDSEGMLYLSVELERFNLRSEELGQLIKLDPNKDDPFVWGVSVPKEEFEVGGIWATPALYKNYLYVPTHTGRLMAVNKSTGEIVWEEAINPHSWSSPVVIDDELLIGSCDGYLKNYSLTDPTKPSLLWSYKLGNGSCIESTPAIWQGQIFVGSRDGYFYKVEEKR